MTTGFFITDSDDYFPDDDFFPDIDNLLDDMVGEDTGPKSSATAAAVPYVFSFLLDILPQFLVLVLALHVLGSTPYMQHDLVSVLDVFYSSSYMQMLFTFSPSGCMTCFIMAILVMLYLVFMLIKSFGKLIIFPTIQKPYYR